MPRKCNVRQHMRRTKSGSTTVTKHDRSLKNLSFSQLHKRGIKLKPTGDADGDGVSNIKDCKPLNKRMQGTIHERLREQEKKLEKRQDLLLRELDKENKTFKEHVKVEEKVRNNKVLKTRLKELRRQNFFMTPAGRVVNSAGKTLDFLGIQTRKIAKDPQTKKELKSLWKTLTK